MNRDAGGELDVMGLRHFGAAARRSPSGRSRQIQGMSLGVALLAPVLIGVLIADVAVLSSHRTRQPVESVAVAGPPIGSDSLLSYTRPHLRSAHRAAASTRRPVQS